jgi:hypothetical protein
VTLRSVVLDARDPRSRALWRELELRAKPAYFFTSGWIDTWLACLDSERAPDLVALFDGERPVAAFHLGSRTVVRHGVFASRARFLNETGDERFDDLCVEHNRVLADPSVRISLADVLAAIPGAWDELYLSGIDGDGAGVDLRTCEPGHVVRVDRRVEGPFVDLERVRAAHDGYPSLLHPNSRTQVRRAIRAFGPAQIEIATTAREAFDIYEELVRLHARHWNERGERGAFADPWIDRFHRRLIADRLPQGEIQLLRVRAGGETVGCLYNLVSHGRVLFYQGGLATFADPHRKAGYLCHALAIELAARAGHRAYDFLGGDARYKRSLATDATELVWARVQRPLARFAVEERLRALSHAASGLLTRIAWPRRPSSSTSPAPERHARRPERSPARSTPISKS